MNRRNFIGLAALMASLTRGRAATQAARERPILSFGLITDVQYADEDPVGERHFRASEGKLKSAVAWLAQQDLPFTLHLGDLVDRDFQSFGRILPLLDGLGHPTYHLLGNHDYSVADGEKARVTSTLGMAQDYYQFKAAGLRFVILDTNDLSVYKYPHDSPKNRESAEILAKLVAVNDSSAKAWNGGLSATQLAWLESALAAADVAKERVILCGHHPILPEEGDRLWYNEGVIEVIDRHPSVIAYFNGHRHSGAEVVRKGVHYITFKSILHEPEVTAYSAIHVFGDRLEIEGNGRERSRVLPLR
jgi:manganese-dependent ADP-ribose/CDP-alcohol diphosphatase